MTEEKPTAAFILSLIAGIFILLNGLFIAAIGSMIASFSLMMPGAGAIGLGIIALGLLFGIIVIIGSLMMMSKPKQTKAWGILVLVFSILSIFIGGGFIIGFILGIVGGALALAWKPTEEEKRICPKCGRMYPVSYNNCPYCGFKPEE